MKAHQLFVLLFTFAVGVASGAYFYVTAYAPQFSDGQTSEPDVITFQIKAESYGQCEQAETCDAWLLGADRQYRFLNGTTGSTTDGFVEWRLFGKLRTTLRQTDRDFFTPPADCQTSTTALFYRYEVTIEGEVFTLDSCNAQFVGSEEADLLDQVWNTVYDRPVEYANQAAAGVLNALIHRN